MKTINFLCTLISDIIINQNSATEGSQQSLDFIPGNNFLGIASAIYETLLEEASIVFHSGKVRFGDAHPALFVNNNWMRSLRVPTSMFHPKLKKASEECYIHHHLTASELKSEVLRNKQLTQCRTGFYLFPITQVNQEFTGIPVEVNKSFSIKSAYDPTTRRSKDSQIYGYQSLEKGSNFMFSLYYDSDVSDDTINKVVSQLQGERHVGRSRTAQYGLVHITCLNMQETNYTSHQTNKQNLIIYAESRLIFLDKFGLPTFTPTPLDFLNIEGEVDWTKSQIRTFQYSPWNFRRGARDADRCGIEKGSVIVIKLKREIDIDKLPEFIGKYQNEGFGKVIYNPCFLDKSESNILSSGNSLYKIGEVSPSITIPAPQRGVTEIALDDDDDALLHYLKAQAQESKRNESIYKDVQSFIDNHVDKCKFRIEAFSSQWGAIRSLAIRHNTQADLLNAISQYISKGVATEKWDDYARGKALLAFINKLSDENAKSAIINLASEMAKLSNKK